MENSHTNTPKNNESVDNNYKRRILVQNKTIQEIKRAGYDAEEALTYFPNLMKERNQLENKVRELQETIKAALENNTRVSAGFQTEVIRNRRLRSVITKLSPKDYFEVIQKAEKGGFGGD